MRACGFCGGAHALDDRCEKAAVISRWRSKVLGGSGGPAVTAFERVLATGVDSSVWASLVRAAREIAQGEVAPRLVGEFVRLCDAAIASAVGQRFDDPCGEILVRRVSTRRAVHDSSSMATEQLSMLPAARAEAEVSAGILVRSTHARFLDALRERLRYPNPEYHRAKALGVWMLPEKWLRSYRDEDGGVRIARGAIAALRDVAAAHGVQLVFRDRRVSAPVAFPPLRGLKTPTDLQERAIVALHKRENARFVAPTGLGKSLCCVELIRRAGQRALFLVPKAGLVAQTVREVADLVGPGVARELKGKPHSLPLISVATYALLTSIRKRDPEWYARIHASFGFLLLDEMHLGAAATIARTVDDSPARYRVGVTATDRRKDGREVLVHDLFGAPADVITLDEAVAAGRIVHARIEVVPTGTRDPEVESLRKRQDSMRIRDKLTGPELRKLAALAEDTVTNDAARTMLIARDVVRDVLADHPCLVLARNLAHVDELAKAIRVVWEMHTPGAAGGQVEVLKGGMGREFDDAVERMRARESLVAVGSAVAYAGLDVPCLERGFIAVPSGTNMTQLEQMVGRFRRVADGKEPPVVRYYWDEHLYPRALGAIRKQFGEHVYVRGQGGDDEADEHEGVAHERMRRECRP